jgi:crotonobetainyl-CoA:carnitine CoA-transferase CaiB-like acyl-CoA transferase
MKHEGEVDVLIATWTRTKEKNEAMRLLGAAGVPAGAVLDTRELQNDPDFERRGIMAASRCPWVPRRCWVSTAPTCSKAG